jgi:hypothetical protein
MCLYHHYSIMQVNLNVVSIRRRLYTCYLDRASPFFYQSHVSIFFAFHPLRVSYLYDKREKKVYRRPLSFPHECMDRRLRLIEHARISIK